MAVAFIDPLGKIAYGAVTPKLLKTVLNRWILATGGVASGRVYACSLRSRLVSNFYSLKYQNVSPLLFSLWYACFKTVFVLGFTVKTELGPQF